MKKRGWKGVPKSQEEASVTVWAADPRDVLNSDKSMSPGSLLFDPKTKKKRDSMEVAESRLKDWADGKTHSRETINKTEVYQRCLPDDDFIRNVAGQPLLDLYGLNRDAGKWAIEYAKPFEIIGMVRAKLIDHKEHLRHVAGYTTNGDIREVEDHGNREFHPHHARKVA
jgi:hypothetical protein